MPNYNFSSDLKIAVITEQEIANLFREKYGHKVVSFSKDNRYDLLIETVRGKVFTVEVKEDFTCEKTGNVGLEFSCRGKPSGVSVSEATHYVYKIHTPKGIRFFIIKTDTLKGMIKSGKYKAIVNGGDKDSSSLNYLFGLNVFISQATEIFI